MLAKQVAIAENGRLDVPNAHEVKRYGEAAVSMGHQSDASDARGRWFETQPAHPQNAC